MADQYADFSKELSEIRRKMRQRLLALGDDDLKKLYYRSIVLSEHEASRRAVDAVLTRSSLSNRAEA